MHLGRVRHPQSLEASFLDLRVHADVILPVFSRRPPPERPSSLPQPPLPALAFASDSEQPPSLPPTPVPEARPDPPPAPPLQPPSEGSRSRVFPTDFIENSLLYQVFRSDFGALLEYCLHPELRPLSHYEPNVKPHSLVLLRMVQRCRVNKLKTEQKIKKVINHAYDLMKRRFLNDRYKNLSHISDSHKREAFVHYFNKDGLPPEEFIRLVTEAPVWRSAEKFNLAYNRRFFSYVRDCPAFLADLAETVDRLETLTVETIRNDLRLFIKDVVRFAYQNCGQPIAEVLPPEQNIEEFFDAKVQRELNKKGIKFPWTEAQYKHSIRILRGYIAGDGASPDPAGSPRKEERDSPSSDDLT